MASRWESDALPLFQPHSPKSLLEIPPTVLLQSCPYFNHRSVSIYQSVHQPTVKTQERTCTMTTSGPGSPTLKSPPREPSHICSRCSLLTFKEEFVERSPKLALDLDELLASRPGRMGWCRVGPIISKGEFDVLATTAYFLSDTLPTLPTLRDSSFKCDFCKKLRDALLVQYTHLLRGVREGPDSKIDQERHGLDPSLLIIRAYYSWFRWSCTRLAVQLRVTIFKQLGHSELGLFREPFFMTWVAEAAKGSLCV